MRIRARLRTPRCDAWQSRARPETGAQGSTTKSTDAMSLRRLRLHEGAELAADVLEQLIRSRPAKLLQLLLARVHLGDPLARERAVLDLTQHVSHRLAYMRIDDPLSTRVV